MTAEGATHGEILLARIVAILIVALIMLGIVWYGLSADVQKRFWSNIFDRPGGPMAFRFYLQPCMAALVAYRDAANDVRAGRSPYLWSLLTETDVSSSRLREGFVATARILMLGLAMDAIYQATVLKSFYPGEMVVMAVLLAFAPYALLRGPFARAIRWLHTHRAGHPS